MMEDPRNSIEDNVKRLRNAMERAEAIANENKDKYEKVDKLLSWIFALGVVLSVICFTFYANRHFNKPEVKKRMDNRRDAEFVANTRYMMFDQHEYVVYQSSQQAAMTHSPRCPACLTNKVERNLEKQ